MDKEDGMINRGLSSSSTRRTLLIGLLGSLLLSSSFRSCCSAYVTTTKTCNRIRPASRRYYLPLIPLHKDYNYRHRSHRSKLSAGRLLTSTSIHHNTQHYEDSDSNTSKEEVDDHDEGLALLESRLEAIADHYRHKSVEEIQKDLVRRGKAFHNNALIVDNEEDQSEQQQHQQLVSPAVKVPGCVANVHLQTVLKTSSSTDKNSLSYRLTRVHGTADALISQGLLALWSYIASSDDNMPVSAILNLEPSGFAQRLELHHALSQGRNDGLASMVRTTQQQIQQTLLENESSSGHRINENNQQQAAVVENDDKDLTADPSKDCRNGAQPQHRAPTVALLLSGGVDSSVALNLLLRQGYNVTAFYLKIWLEDELAHLGTCPWEDDYRSCVDVCRQAEHKTGIAVPLHTISLQQAYRDRVISYTIQEAQQGRTPNPDIMCNSRIKFGCFYDELSKIDSSGSSGYGDFDYIATGHYAQLVEADDDDNGSHETTASTSKPRKRLLRAPDPVKDQSYFLCALTQQQLSRVLFPIGHLQKSEVRALANKWELPNRHRPDSQGLCFLGKVKFEDFLGNYLGDQPGPIVDAATGDAIGQHKGLWYHTVGQRRGIGKVLDPLATSKGPWYVVAKDPQRNVVFCSNAYDQEAFAAPRSQFTVENIQWIAGQPPKQSQSTPPSVKHDDDSGRAFSFDMKIRHGPKLAHGSLTLEASDRENNSERGVVRLDEKDSGLAPGQYVVFYQDDECLGGGVISENHWATFLGNFEAMQHSSASAT